MITIEPIGDLALCKDKSVIPRNYWGLSTDPKPEGVANGSRYITIDKGDVFCYDAENKVWHPW